jgi:hypothetical protein
VRLSIEGKWAFTRHESAGALILDFPASKTVGKYIYVFGSIGDGTQGLVASILPLEPHP